MKHQKQVIKRGQPEQKNEIAYFLTKNAFGLIGFFVGVPVTIQVCSIAFNVFKNGLFVASGDWLGFWGGYLGVIPSGLLAYYVTMSQINLEKRFRDKENADNLQPIFLASVYFERCESIHVAHIDIKGLQKNANVPMKYIRVLPTFYESDGSVIDIEDQKIFKQGSAEVCGVVKLHAETNIKTEKYELKILAQLIDGRVVTGIISLDNEIIYSKHWIKDGGYEHYYEESEISIKDFIL
ncbi:hypothetical protein [Weissella cibaria]|uniref:hypothetical protein n=1 Tax=Weissella cibaria TaxID=137591 RepID=UPI00113226A5|nr:hypothetical protein [Weissella cibaria]QDG80405.1 hypothetical protein Wei3612_03030 [Weissella cibaria]